MAALAAVYQSPANADNSGVATGKYVQTAVTAEDDIFVDLGFVPRVVILSTLDVAAASWLHSTWMADGESLVLSTGDNTASEGITFIDTDEATLVPVAGDHVIREGVDHELSNTAVPWVDNYDSLRGFFIGTTCQGAADKLVTWIAWK